MTGTENTYVFDIRARVDGDNITVLDTQVVANDTVYPRGAIIEIVVCAFCDAEADAQKEVGRCSISYLTKKSACNCWRSVAFCC